MDKTALNDCHLLGFHPKRYPNGDDHHTAMPFNDEDERIVNAIAYFLGSLFSDIEGESPRYWYHERTSVDEWRRVARALRIHGLRITDEKQLG